MAAADGGSSKATEDSNKKRKEKYSNVDKRNWADVRQDQTKKKEEWKKNRALVKLFFFDFRYRKGWKVWARLGGHGLLTIASK